MTYATILRPNLSECSFGLSLEPKRRLRGVLAGPGYSRIKNAGPLSGSRRRVPNLDQNMNEFDSCHSCTGEMRAAAQVWPSGSTEIGMSPLCIPTL
jgi:hypothetical protein